MNSSENPNSEFPENLTLGSEIAEAAEENDAVTAEQLIRSHEMIVLQRIDPETGQVEFDEDDNFSVVLAEVDEDIAVVCFSNFTAASSFMDSVCEDLTGGSRLPAVVLDGNELLDGLPESVGLLVDPTTENESYFPPGCFSDFCDSPEDDEEVDEENDSFFPDA
jgi:hypothetical protein